MIRVIIKNSLHQSKNRDEVNNRGIRYLPDLSIVNLLSVFVLVQRILNYYPTHRLYFGEVEKPYRLSGIQTEQKTCVFHVCFDASIRISCGQHQCNAVASIGFCWFLLLLQNYASGSTVQ